MSVFGEHCTPLDHTILGEVSGRTSIWPVRSGWCGLCGQTCNMRFPIVRHTHTHGPATQLTHKHTQMCTHACEHTHAFRATHTGTSSRKRLPYMSTSKSEAPIPLMLPPEACSTGVCTSDCVMRPSMAAPITCDRSGYHLHHHLHHHHIITTSSLKSSLHHHHIIDCIITTSSPHE